MELMGYEVNRLKMPSRFERQEMVDEHFLYLYTDNYICVGICAAIMNGFTTEWLNTHLVFYIDCRELGNMDIGTMKFVYLPDYRPEGNVPSPEKCICDFIKYPEELNASRWLYLTMRDYEEDYETPDNWDLVYKKAEEMGIPKEDMDKHMEVYYRIRDNI